MFKSRRVARKIGQDDGEASSDASSNNGKHGALMPQSGRSDDSSHSRLMRLSDSQSSLVKRPLSKNRKPSALRASFASADDQQEPSGLVTPKRSNLSRVAIQRNAEKRSNVPFRAANESDQHRPSYSKDYLDELKQSTPTTPRDVSSYSASATDNEDTDMASARAVDVASKFGSNLARYQPPAAIPTDAEIKEKKERRARLAKEHDFISLQGEDGDGDDEDDDDAVTRDEEGRLILKPKEKYPETRLLHDDEDILEGFDDFTSDGKMTFGRKAEREAEQRRKAEMASLIADAEGHSADADEDEQDDDSEAERNAAFEVAQTRHGTYASRDQDADSARPQTPPKVVPLPALDAVVERLRRRLQEMETLRTGKTNEMQGLVNEKERIGQEEIRVQAALKETGDKYQKLREDMGLQAKENDAQVAAVNGDPSGSDQSSEEAELDERPGLGTGGLGSTTRRDMADWDMQ